MILQKTSKKSVRSTMFDIRLSFFKTSAVGGRVLWKIMGRDTKDLSYSLLYCRCRDKSKVFIVLDHLSPLVVMNKKVIVSCIADTPQNKAFFKCSAWIVQAVSVVAIILVSLSRTHYTMDILIAYAITTTIFRIYHTAVSYPELRVRLRISMPNK